MDWSLLLGLLGLALGVISAYPQFKEWRSKFTARQRSRRLARLKERLAHVSRLKHDVPYVVVCVGTLICAMVFFSYMFLWFESMPPALKAYDWAFTILRLGASYGIGYFFAEMKILYDAVSDADSVIARIQRRIETIEKEADS